VGGKCLSGRFVRQQVSGQVAQILTGAQLQRSSSVRIAGLNGFDQNRGVTGHAIPLKRRQPLPC
jgi:hypothetical protein